MPSWLTGPTCNDGSASLICDGLDGPACRDVTTLQRRVDNAWRPQAQGPSFIDSNGDPAGRRPSRERCRNGEEEEEEQGLVARQFPGLYRGPRRGDPGHRPCHRGSRCVRREHFRAPRSERQGNGQVVEEQQARKEERRPGLIPRPTSWHQETAPAPISRSGRGRFIAQNGAESVEDRRPRLLAYRLEPPCRPDDPPCLRDDDPPRPPDEL